MRRSTDRGTQGGRVALLGVAAAAGLAYLGGSAAASAKDVTIGWTSYPADIPVIADAVDGGKNAAKEIGAKLQFALSAGAAAQANAMDNLIALGVDVIAIDPEDSKAIGPSIKKANEANIPVIMFIGDNLGGGKTVTLISSDESRAATRSPSGRSSKSAERARLRSSRAPRRTRPGSCGRTASERPCRNFPASSWSPMARRTGRPTRPTRLLPTC